VTFADMRRHSVDATKWRSLDVSVGDPWVLAVIATPIDWVLSVAEYSIFIRPDLLQQFWQVMSVGAPGGGCWSTRAGFGRGVAAG